MRAAAPPELIQRVCRLDDCPDGTLLHEFRELAVHSLEPLPWCVANPVENEEPAKKDSAVDEVRQCTQELHRWRPQRKSRRQAVDAGHFIWEDAADEHAALVNAWWSEGFKRCMKRSTPTARVLECTSSTASSAGPARTRTSRGSPRARGTTVFDRERLSCRFAHIIRKPPSTTIRNR